MITYKIKDMSLTQDEIKKLFENKVLSKNLYSVFDNDAPNSYNDMKHQIDNCINSNVLMMFKVSAGEYLLFTDNFLIICAKHICFNPLKYEIPIGNSILQY